MQVDWEVSDIVEMCSRLELIPEGTAVSLDKCLSLPPRFQGTPNESNKLAITAVWPCSADVTKGNVEGKLGLFKLQVGLSHAVVCAMNLRAKCIQDVSFQLEDHQCIMFDAFCSGSMLQNVTFQGARRNRQDTYVGIS